MPDKTKNARNASNTRRSGVHTRKSKADIIRGEFNRHPDASVTDVQEKLARKGIETYYSQVHRYKA